MCTSYLILDKNDEKYLNMKDMTTKVRLKFVKKKLSAKVAKKVVLNWSRGRRHGSLGLPWIAPVVHFKIVSLSSQLNFVGHEHFFNTIQMITSQCECA